MVTKNTKRRTSTWLLSAWLLILILALPGLASAKAKGRLIGKVVDQDGQPIEGVTVTATSEMAYGFKEVEVTDKKGIFKIDFDEVEVVYLYRFDKVGYQTVKTEQTWRKLGSARHTFTMPPGEAAPVESLAPASKSAPAVEAYNAGAAAFKAGDAAAAIASLEEALGHDPELRQAWAVLGLARLKAGQYQGAAEAAEKAIALGAADQGVLRARWEAYRQLGDEAKTAEALAAVEQAGIAAEEAKRVFNEAVRAGKADDHETAFVKFKEASELDPSLREALRGMATNGLATGRYQEAITAAKELLADDSQDESALRVRYNAALKLADDSQIFDALLGLAPIEPEAARDGLWNMALAAFEANDMALARERFGKLAPAVPSLPQSHYYLGLIEVREGAAAEAKRHFERFLELAPDDPEAGSARDFLQHL